MSVFRSESSVRGMQLLPFLRKCEKKKFVLNIVVQGHLYKNISISFTQSVFLHNICS